MEVGAGVAKEARGLCVTAKQVFKRRRTVKCGELSENGVSLLSVTVSVF
jgi:hypothetical protein